MKNVHALLNDLADIQARCQRESDDIETGKHNDYGLYDELRGDIGDLLIDNAAALTSLLGKLNSLTEAVDASDTAAESGDIDDSHDEAIRVAARSLVEQACSVNSQDTGPDFTELRQAHTTALRAADGDSNDDEIAAWRETAELATAYLPGYQEPDID